MLLRCLPELNQGNLLVSFTAPLVKDTVQFNLYPKAYAITFPTMIIRFFGPGFLWPENANRDYIYNISITDGIQMIEFAGCSIEHTYYSTGEITMTIRLGTVVENATTMMPRPARTYTEITFPYVEITTETL